MGADEYPKDIFTDPDADPDTLANLGPLTGMAGVWESAEGIDEHPVVTPLPKAPPSAASLLERRRHLPLVDPDRLRADIDG